MGEMRHWENCYGCLDVEHKTPHSTNCDRGPKPAPAEAAAELDSPNFTPVEQSHAEKIVAAMEAGKFGRVRQLLAQRISDLEASLQRAEDRINGANLVARQMQERLEQAQQALQRVTEERDDALRVQSEVMVAVEERFVERVEGLKRTLREIHLAATTDWDGEKPGAKLDNIAELCEESGIGVDSEPKETP